MGLCFVYYFVFSFFLFYLCGFILCDLVLSYLLCVRVHFFKIAFSLVCSLCLCSSERRQFMKQLQGRSSKQRLL